MFLEGPRTQQCNPNATEQNKTQRITAPKIKIQIGRIGQINELSKRGCCFILALEYNCYLKLSPAKPLFALYWTRYSREHNRDEIRSTILHRCNNIVRLLVYCRIKQEENKLRNEMCKAVFPNLQYNTIQ